MNKTFSLLPEQASTVAGQIDALYVFLVAISVFFTILTAVLVILFAVKYRRRSESEVPAQPHEDSTLEILCGSILLVLTLVIFGWGAKIFFDNNKTPADAMEIMVVGKQWMWKLQHATGKREINELHVPVGQPVQLTMTSEDVIHSLFIPAFRVKQDVVPGRYTKVWFEATRPGTYNLFCTEYCGTDHSRMGGLVYAMAPTDYERWLRGAGAAAETPVEAGARLFAQLGCATCHNADSAQLGPSLTGVYGHQAKMTDGTEVMVDDAYLRESILNSQAKIVAGFQPVMPLFKGMISEDQLLNLMAYIKSLTPPAGGSK
jgi:cytochrome c oxidase subunit 2